ncbi:protein MEI2-like 2 isoform X4 [Carya illinoinensis]|uniref:RRM domain-containing protein n=3 Tax=Carya illinoinensis TaxID=32201 RepID=A0A8T1R668_CARIL|nr:protein MEI2-like 2 isoform X4 [Carya illinoinensis]KAG6661642.1 hypothetical protein CIPAW_03G188600 [Carya illinoinensis]KAG6722827.1 hypothetical protein I3842_03G180400 [Carya illinoinensis]KAG6722831.1 hypothetical protein I3842_03G180400 [Carya illinoinensis]
MLGHSEGQFNITAVNVLEEAGKTACGIAPGISAFHSSNDVGLFSSSLMVLPREILNFTDFEHGGQSVDDYLPNLNKLHQVNEPMNPLEHVEANAIERMLPDDEVELFAGIMDDFDLSGLPIQLEDLEDDLFSSGGSMELDLEAQESLSIGISKLSICDGITSNGIGHYAVPNSVGTVAGEHPYGEHPSRTLFVRNININVEDSELRALFEQYGDIRTLYTACKHRGFVMISYYDIRDARTAMRALQNKPLRRRKLDIHFSIPKDNPSEKDINQGTLVVFNLDPSVSNDDLCQIFGVYGEVKEIRETPHKRHHKFIEFYDVRAAEAALKALNRSDIAGKRIKLEPSRPGGARRSLMQQLSQELELDEARGFQYHVGSPVTNSSPGNWLQFGSAGDHNPLHAFSKSPGRGNLSPLSSNQMPGLTSIPPRHLSNSAKFAPIGKDTGRVNLIFPNTGQTQGTAYQHSRSFSEQKFIASPGTLSPCSDMNLNSPGIGTLSGPQFLWGSPGPYSEHINSSAWQTSSVGHPFASSGHDQGFPYTGEKDSFLGLHNHHHVGSAPSVVPLQRQFGFFPESPDTSFMNPVAFSNMDSSRNNVMNIGAHVGLSGNVTENGSPSFRIMSLPRHAPMFLGNGSYPGPRATGYEGLGECGPSRRVENSWNLTDGQKQYQLDLDKIISGEDFRTTLMIKNIPNKYTSKMLLAAIDENHQGTYDFIYLPIDFKNKCNVGYAFINMVSPSHIIPFYEAFHGKKWEKFNSEKVSSLAYARIQGKPALVTHFQNSSLTNEDRQCWPIIFSSEGQETSDQEPFLSRNLNICIRQPDGSYSGDSLESPKGNVEKKPEKD